MRPGAADASAAASVDTAIATLRVVVLALAGGLVLMTGVAVTLSGSVASDPPEPTLRALLLGLIAVFGVAAAGAYVAIGRAQLVRLRARAAELRQHPQPEQLVVDAYRTRVIVGGGLAEGPGVFAAIVHLLTASPWALAGVAAALALLIAQLPSRDGLRRLADEAARP